MSSQRFGDGTIEATGSTTYDEVDAKRFDASGSTRVAGDLRADEVDLSGSTEVGGDVLAVAVAAAGSVAVEGDVRADEFDCSGSVRLGSVRVEDTLECAGSSEFGPVEAGRFVASGSTRPESVLATDVAVAGSVATETIDARTVELNLAGESTVDRIVADSIAVAPHEVEGLLGTLGEVVGDLFGDGDRGRLVADRIEGEEVDLEGAHVVTVVGDVVRLGPDVSVETVRARELEAHPDADVGTVERLESVERTDTGVETVERVE